jgi:alpha-1,3-rhamnosyl/mannosyltransferase
MSRPVSFVYDLRYASDHFSGIGTHAYGLLRALLAAPGEERWRVVWSPTLACSRFDLGPLRAHPRVDWVETDVPPMGWRTAAGTGALLRRLGGGACLSPFWLLPERPGMPVVLTVHDVLPLAVPGTMSWPRRVLYRMALDRAAAAAAVLVSSRFTLAEVARHTRIPGARLHVVPLGLLPPPKTAGVRPAGVPQAPFALVVGVNKPHKNLEVLARAWSGPAAPPLALVGAGFVDERYPSLAELAAAAGAQPDAVTWLGRVDGAELEWLYRNATLVLCPTRYEGFGLPLLEAAARGTAVVASDIPPLRETGDGVVRFVPPGDPAAWAATVRALAGDAGARAALAGAARARAADFDYAVCARRTLDVLREVAGGTP